jgi:UDP-glucose 4-epimerase
LTILVTGGAGYIGSHTVHELIDAGERVVVLDNLDSGFADALPASAVLIVGNVGNQPLVGEVITTHSVDAIIHFAGSIVVPESMRDPLSYYNNNTVNSRALIESAVRGGVRQFIFSSTAAVYGNPARVPVAEDAPALPISPYGWSKLMTEVMLRDVAAAHGLGHVILRYFNVAGADPHGRTGQSTPNASHLIKVAIQAALGIRSQLEIFGSDYPTRDGTCIRDYVHVTDLARAHLAALAYLRQGGTSTTLNCGYGRGYSVREVVAAVRRAADRDFAVSIGQRRFGDPASIVAAAAAIRAVLNWTPEWDDLNAIVRHALSWERNISPSVTRPIPG